MGECMHRELVFFSGDHYVVCANTRCGRRWATIDYQERVAPELSNRGGQASLSGKYRREPVEDDGK
jgi:hypothetical protein